MPFDINGTYTLPAGNPVVADTIIEADWANLLTPDLAAALTSAFLKDGRSTPTADLKMGSFKFLTVGAATAVDQFPQVQQVQNDEASWCGVSTGAADAQLLTPAIAGFAPTVYQVGQRFRFQAGFTNTGPATLKIATLVAGAAQMSSVALVAGQIAVGAFYEVFVSAITPVFQLNQIGAAVSIGAGAVTASMLATDTGDRLFKQSNLGGL